MNIIFKVLRYLKKKKNLIKIAALIAFMVVIVFQAIQLNHYKSSYQEEVKSGSAIAKELDSIRNEKNLLETQVSEYEQIILDKDIQIQQLQKDVQELEDTAAKLASAQKGTFKADGNYNQAREVWNALKDLGLNDYVCAGIMGNIMAEVGGQTLDISRWPIYSQGTYYGICQWAGGRKQRLLNDFGTTLNDQIRFLSVELFEVIPKENSFYSMQDEQEAALYFAKKYERCNSKYYSVRQKNATKALEYFTK